jgi:ribonuclease D
MPAFMNKSAHRSGISRDEIAELPVRRYEGEVRLVETAADIELAMADVTAETVVGFDTETRPSFRKGEVYLPALVQAATAQRVYLFQLRWAAVHEAVAHLLASAHVVKAGVAVAHDLRTLKAVFPFEPQNVVDLGVLARRRGMEQTGLRNLTGLLLGYRIPKGAKTTNWAAHRLSEAQIAYAATDAWACRELYLRFATLGLLEHAKNE